MVVSSEAPFSSTRRGVGLDQLGIAAVARNSELLLRQRISSVAVLNGTQLSENVVFVLGVGARWWENGTLKNAVRRRRYGCGCRRKPCGLFVAVKLRDMWRR